MLADTFAGTGVEVVKIDADAHKELGSEYGVTGFPTLKCEGGSSSNGSTCGGGTSLILWERKQAAERVEVGQTSTDRSLPCFATSPADFPAGSTKAEDYNGGRALDELITFVNGKLGSNKKVKKPVSAVIDLDDSNVDAILGDASKAKLLELYAPW